MPHASPAQRLSLDGIKLHPDLQIRGGTDFGTVRRYAREMRQGDEFPAITLAEVGGNLYIIDGHHRYDAAQQAGLKAILATKRRMSLSQARLAAYAANGQHGRKITATEKQHAFARFIELGMHLNAAGNVKPLRQIADECPVYSFQHIGRKLKERGIKAPRGDVKPYTYGYGCAEETADEARSEDDETLLDDFRQHLASAMSIYNRLDASTQATALTEMREQVTGLTDPLQI